jgi:hypothetical protein
MVNCFLSITTIEHDLFIYYTKYSEHNYVFIIFILFTKITTIETKYYNREQYLDNILKYLLYMKNLFLIIKI